MATFTVRGRKHRSDSKCRFIAVAVRPVDFVAEDGVYVAFTRTIKRSADVSVVKKAAKRYGFGRGAYAVVIDTTTGEEV